LAGSDGFAKLMVRFFHKFDGAGPVIGELVEKCDRICAEAGWVRNRLMTSSDASGDGACEHFEVGVRFGDADAQGANWKGATEIIFADKLEMVVFAAEFGFVEMLVAVDRVEMRSRSVRLEAAMELRKSGSLESNPSPRPSPTRGEGDRGSKKFMNCAT
jgi:hypothetical protein